jgi:hypothetical protein
MSVAVIRAAAVEPALSKIRGRDSASANPAALISNTSHPVARAPNRSRLSRACCSAFLWIRFESPSMKISTFFSG